MLRNHERELLICNAYYGLSRIIEGDRENYVELQRQVNGDSTFYLNPLSKDIMWEGTLSDFGIYVILDMDNKFCGTVELKDESRTPEIGISILEEYRNRGIAKCAVSLLISLTYNPRNIDFYVVRIESKNLHSRHVFEKLGAEYLGPDLSSLDRFKEYLVKEHYEEEIQNDLVDAFLKFEGDSQVLKYRLDPNKLQSKKEG